MSTLYVTEPGARLEKEYQRLLVVKDDEVLLRVPLRRITQVVLVGRVGATTPALHSLLRQEIPVLLVSRSGKLLGRLLPPTAANLPLRQAQYRRNTDAAFCLRVARRIVRGKIRNQRVLAQRLLRRRSMEAEKPVLAMLHDAMRQALQAPALDALLGIEGLAARRYFSLYRRAFDEEWASPKRTRRPPKDPLNALLSLGYTFLSHAIMTALETAGLDPYLGYFHAEKYGRPALALDLMEEFRTPVVDSLVLNIVNHRILRHAHFRKSGASAGVYLTPTGMRIFLAQFSRKLESTVTLRRIGRPLSYRKLFEVQARAMARCIRGEEETYHPFQAR